MKALLKWWKILFISCWKFLSFLRYLHFGPDFLVMLKNGLIRKRGLIAKFMTSQTGQQIITIFILPNISRSKGKHAMKIGQLIDCKVRNIFLEKLYIKWVGETSLKSFYKKLKLSISRYLYISRSTVWRFINFVLLYVQVNDYQNISKLWCSALNFTFDF